MCTFPGELSTNRADSDKIIYSEYRRSTLLTCSVRECSGGLDEIEHYDTLGEVFAQGWKVTVHPKYSEPKLYVMTSTWEKGDPAAICPKCSYKAGMSNLSQEAPTHTSGCNRGVFCSCLEYCVIDDVVTLFQKRNE